MTEHQPQESQLIPGPDHPLTRKEERYEEARQQLIAGESELESKSKAGRVLGRLGVWGARGHVKGAKNSYSRELLDYKRPGYKPLDRE